MVVNPERSGWQPDVHIRDHEFSPEKITALATRKRGVDLPLVD